MTSPQRLPLSPRPPRFDAQFRAVFADLLAWRRDVRRFRPEPVPDGELRALLELAVQAPSVGNSQPWRFVEVRSTERREAITENFKSCNADALAAYCGERAQTYARLKLSGLGEAPVHLAAFCDTATTAGGGLGRRTMPETLSYSVVLAIHTLWLAARTRGLGVGWVSILDPQQVMQVLDVPQDWKFVAYLCIGYPVEEHTDPELERHGWQERLPLDPFVTVR